MLGFPGDTVHKNPPAEAGDMDSISESGRITHALEQLSPWAAPTEPALRARALQQEKPPQGEARAPPSCGAPTCCNGREAHATTKTQSWPK